jgi:hypothetical protein
MEEHGIEERVTRQEKSHGTRERERENSIKNRPHRLEEVRTDAIHET